MGACTEPKETDMREIGRRDGFGGAAASHGAVEVPRGQLETPRRGRDLISHSLLNKGAGFPEDERDALGLRGLLPTRVMTIEEQVQLELEHVRRKTDDLERYIGLAALQDRNETLFYRVLAEYLDEFLPIVYTPTVGRACQEFSHIFRRPRGVWITPADVGRIDDILRTAADDAIRLIVVTDNERILGLGDQGAGGMAIPVGKLALYTAAAGIYPAWTLPVSLDVGTDRVELLDDPLYLGYRAPRLRGRAYDGVLEAFVESVRRVFPSAVIQWEDFKQHNAVRILDRYRHRVTSFNDDIQGTGAVVVAGLLAARRREGGLAGDRFLFLGAGAAAIGIAGLLQRELAAEGAVRRDDRPVLAMIDRTGLVHLGREQLAEDQRPFAVDPAWFIRAGVAPEALTDPVAIARALKASVLIGTTGCRGAFTESLVREVGRHSRTPIVLPLSNPGDREEAEPADILRWTEGRALVATGSPSGDVESSGRSWTIGQANNVFIFPGVGLGAIVAEAREVTDETFLVAARELAALVSARRIDGGAIYPPVGDLRQIARVIALAVVRHLRDTGFGRQYRDEEIAPAVDRAMWWPEYPSLVPTDSTRAADIPDRVPGGPRRRDVRPVRRRDDETSMSMKGEVSSMLTVRDVMTHSVTSVQRRAPLKEVAQALIDNNISGVPVVDVDGSVLGVVSEADFLIKEQGADAIRHRPLARFLGESSESRDQLVKLGATTAGDAMTAPAVTITPGRSIHEAAAIMTARRVNRLPVVDDGRLVGIVSRADLVRAYVRSDDELATTIRQDVILRILWLDPALFTVVVKDGVAAISGRVERRSTAEMIEHSVRMVPGIVDVHVSVSWSIDDRTLEPAGLDPVFPFGPR
jgi:malic enzyme/predicted transcriptional regulator